RPPLTAGDRVDLLATVEGAATRSVAAGVVVVAADERTVTVAVTQADAVTVADAVVRGTVTVALVP
ncbi:MAG: hypothetical protein ACRD0F_07540, partial [Acidimicrobiales bacterium]